MVRFFRGLRRVAVAALLVLVALAFVPSARAGAQEALVVYYFERPPYYYTHDGHPAGFLLKRAERIFRAADVPVRFESIPPKRIMHRLRSADPCCSVGWFRTPQRETFAKFTRPIHQDKVLVALFRHDVADRVYRHFDVESLLRDRSLVMGAVDGFSYGRVVDDLVRRHSPNMELVTAGQRQMVAMMSQGRFDYMFMAPEEADVLLSESSPKLGPLLLHILAGVPLGNTRHIMCSSTVSDETVERLDRAVQALGLAVE